MRAPPRLRGRYSHSGLAASFIGGPDLDRRAEVISNITLSSDAKRATLKLDTLRPGFVYEIQLKNLAPAGDMFHPDQAHYTLNEIPL